MAVLTGKRINPAGGCVQRTQSDVTVPTSIPVQGPGQNSTMRVSCRPYTQWKVEWGFLWTPGVTTFSPTHCKLTTCYRLSDGTLGRGLKTAPQSTAKKLAN
jgi:hypothetical protein